MKNSSYFYILAIVLMVPSLSFTMNAKTGHKEASHDTEHHSIKNSSGPTGIILRKVEMIESLAKSIFFGFCSMVSGYKGACLLIENSEGYLSQHEHAYLGDVHKRTAIKKIGLGGCILALSYYLGRLAVIEARRAEELYETPKC